MHIAFMRNGNNSDHQHHLANDYIFNNLATLMFLGVLMIAGTVGNCLVFLIYLIKMEPSTIRCFILALSIIDLITSSICIPVDIVNLIYNFTFYTVWVTPCKLTALVTFTAFASGSILVCVATDRFKKICRPFGQQLTIKTAKVAILLACIAAALGSLPAFIFYCKHTDLVEGGNFKTNATFGNAENAHDTTFFLIYSAFQFFVFVTCIVTFAVLYFLIWKGVIRFTNNKQMAVGTICSNITRNCASKRGEKTIENHLSRNDKTTESDTPLPKSPDRIKPSNSSAGDKRDHSKHQILVRRTTFMFFVITFTFIVSYLPHLSLKVVRLVYKDKIDNLTGPAFAFYHVFYRSYFINFAVNPFIYSYFDINARNSIKALFRFERCLK